jgi:hypothetical protein
MVDGDRIYVHYHETDTMEGTALQSTGTRSFAGGTGKMKGLKGQGTHKSTAAADGTVTIDVEGEYTLPK